MSDQSRRKDFPLVRETGRASKARALEAAASSDSKRLALGTLFRDMSAASSRATNDSLWATWIVFHEEWFGHRIPALPLTQDKLFAVAACFKEGGYKTFPSYLSKAKEHYVMAGHPWGFSWTSRHERPSLRFPEA